MKQPKFLIKAVSISEDGQTEVARTLYATRDKPSHENAIAHVRSFAVDAPKLREPNKGNARPVRICGIYDTGEVLRHKSAGHYSPALQVGSQWPSVKAASEAFGMSEHTFKVMFSRERKKAPSNPVINVRGFQLCFNDLRDTVSL